MKLLVIIFLNVFSVCLIAQNRTAEQEIKQIMQKQEKCWNLGDIPCFMEGYWLSDSLQFIGSSGITFGYKKTLENYLQKYPDKATMGILKFDILSFEFLCEDKAFVVGKWHLSRDEKGDIGGHFTLIWKRINDNWVIVSDHSS